ncbi:SymE family type I addiction module toxin [Trabulsiella odontotermitis]|uniref:SymE family type I addiction module toxin n=1 Tax=Trabulsiella odontotermitis TaxID=379893 RepID=UPI0006BA4991|nr:SymE family type I addiction module toxin [Trabulsiella odontotermitis]
MHNMNVTTNNPVPNPLRRLTVSYVRKRHIDLDSGRATRLSCSPSLVLSGKWLEEAGFSTGTSVSVAVESGMLVIRSLPQKESR